MKKPNRNPVAIVTGAGKRLGRAIAIQLAERGCDLILHYNNSKTEAHSLAKDIKIKLGNQRAIGLVKAELADAGSTELIVTETLNRFGRIDYLINNASIFFPTPLLKSLPNRPDESQLEEFKANFLEQKQAEASLHQFLGINCIQPLSLLAQAYPYLKRTKGAAVNLLDIYANAGLSQHSLYVATKSALQHMTKQSALKFAPDVRVNGVSPGAILWPDDAASCSDSQRQQIIQQSALKRLGRPEDIAHGVGYLCLDAHYTTGSILRIDGGRNLYI